MFDLDGIARRLGGERSGFQISCPGPGHSPRDRSLSVGFAPNGSFVVHSHAGDDFGACRDLRPVLHRWAVADINQAASTSRSAA